MDMDRSPFRLLGVDQMRVRTLSLIFGACAAIGGTCTAAEERVWTSRKGADVTAQLLRVEGENALLVTPEPREIKLKIEDLSLVDRHYLVEYGGANPKILSSSKLGVPEADARDMTREFERLKDKLELGTDAKLHFETLKTTHFLVVTAGKIRPIKTAEMAERLWRGMAFQHLNFREDWGDKRKLVFLVENDDAFGALGDWYKKHLETLGGDYMAKVAARTRLLWDEADSTAMYLPDALVEKFGLFETALVFNIRDNAKSYGDVFGPFPTHSLASSLLNQQMGGVADYADEGYFAITTGHSYYKEIKLAKRTETMLIDAELYDNDDITKAEGFQDGTSWAKTLREMVRKGKVKPNLEKMFTWEQKDLTPEGLVLIYSFGYYLQSTPERMNAFAQLVRRIEYSASVPVPIEIARIFGFKTAAEFEADWIQFIRSQNFK